METTEKVVEAYVRYIKNWATIPNIKCPGQFEIDLIAIDPVGLNRYHIETGVSISGPYSRLTDKPFSASDLKRRVKQAGQRRTMSYFIERKFGAPEVIEVLKNYGFKENNYKKVIVTWGWNGDAEKRARDEGVMLWDFRGLLREIVAQFKKKKTYFTDDTIRTLHLFSLIKD